MGETDIEELGEFGKFTPISIGSGTRDGCELAGFEVGWGKENLEAVLTANRVKILELLLAEAREKLSMTDIELIEKIDAILPQPTETSS